MKRYQILMYQKHVKSVYYLLPILAKVYKSSARAFYKTMKINLLDLNDHTGSSSLIMQKTNTNHENHVLPSSARIVIVSDTVSLLLHAVIAY